MIYSLNRHFLLAGRGFDAEKLNQELSSIELKASYEPLEPLGDTDIDDYLRHHHDMIVVTAIEETRTATEKYCDDFTMKHLNNDWEIAKKNIIEDLGHHRGKYEGPTDSTTTRSRKRLTYGESGLATSMSDTALNSAVEAVSLMQPPNSIPGGSSNMSGIASQRRGEMTEKMRQYASAVRALNSSQQSDSRSGFDFAGEFVKVEEKKLNINVAAASGSDFLVCWQLVRSMLHQGDPAQATAAIRGQEYAKDYRDGTPKLQRGFANGARVYLEEQFYRYMMNAVKAANKEVGGMPGLLPVIREFVGMTQSTRITPNAPTLDDRPLWSMVYCCIRCGGMTEALDLLKRAVSSGISDVTREFIDVLEHLSRTKSSPLSERPATIAVATQKIRSMYTQMSTSERPVDPYKKYVCNILALVDPNQSDTTVVTTIEDFMWQRLCFCVAAESDYTVRKLADTIRRFGSRHFDRNGKTPVVYFQVLLLAQEFEHAVDYILQRHFHVEAVHFALVLYHYGSLLTMTESANTSKDQMSSRNGGILVLTGKGQPAGKPLINLALLIKQYTRAFYASHTRDAVEYMVLIQDKELRNELLGQLLIETGSLKELAGELLSNGTREGGLFDSFIKSDVHALLCRAGALAERNGRPLDAVNIYICAGDLKEGISILNRQLAQVLNPPHAERDLWKNKAGEIATKYLSEPWAKELLSEDASLGITYQILLNLSMFFDIVGESRWADAIHFMDDLELLPTKIQVTVNQYFDLDELVRMNFDKILIAYMECLRNEYNAVRQQRPSSRRDEIMQKLRQNASNVVSYATMIKFQLPPGTNDRLNQIETLML